MSNQPKRRIDPTVDCVFKKLLGSEKHKAITLSFLNAFLDLEGDRRLSEITFLNPYLGKNHLFDKEPIVDIKGKDGRQNVYQIEVQKLIEFFTKPRMFYGWSKVNAGMLDKGESYNALKHGISIWILTERLFKPEETDATCLKFRLHCPEAGLDLWQGSYLLVVQLPNFKDDVKMSREKAMWIKFFREARFVDPNEPPGWLLDPYLQEALNVLQEFANDVDAYMAYDSIEKAQREQFIRTTFYEQTIQNYERSMDETKAELGETKAELGETKAELAKAKETIGLLSEKIQAIEAKLLGQ